jgi:hypothetical protein
MTTVRRGKQLYRSCAALALMAGASGLFALVAPATQANGTAVVNSNSQFAIDLYEQIDATAGTDGR